jgi:hypothetical protein
VHVGLQVDEQLQPLTDRLVIFGEQYADRLHGLPALSVGPWLSG